MNPALQPSGAQSAPLTAVGRALAVLVQAGLPIGATFRTGSAPSPAAMAEAALTVMRADPAAADPASEPWVREAVGAFLLGWSHEWPTSFAAAFGAEQGPALRWARANTPDPGRYVKLRRLAIANLARHL